MSAPAKADGYSFVDYLRVEKVGGLLLLGAAALALLIANSPLHGMYETLLHAHIGPAWAGLNLSVQHWASDGLLAVFFYVAGVEIKRELTVGELAERKAAALPVLAAAGGMIVPALLFVAFTAGTPFTSGWAIPTATDIAFALGVLAVAGAHAPASLRLFLLSLAVVDDLGAIAIIATVYTDNVQVLQLAAAALLLALFAVLQARRVTSWWVYVPLAVTIWTLVHASGVHATVAGVALGLLTRARPDGGEGHSPAERLEHRLQPWTAGLCVPLFAFTAAGVAVDTSTVNALLSDPVALGIMFGLVAGKTVGVLLGAWLAVRLQVATLPAQLNWADVLGVAVLAGTGFTVSLLVAQLSLPATSLPLATVAVLLASLLASALAACVFRLRRSAHLGEADAY